MTASGEPDAGDRPVSDAPAFSEPTLDELYENAPTGYLSLAVDGTIGRVNQTFLNWTGFERDQLIGVRRFSDLLTIGGRVYYETHCAPLLAMNGGVREITVDVKCVDGHKLPVLFGADGLRDAAGNLTEFRVTVVDVSHRRSYERQLLASRDAERAGREEERLGREAERLGRERAEALQRLSDGLGGVTRAADIEAVLVAHVVAADGVAAAEVFRPSGGLVRTDPSYLPAEGGRGVVGLVPMLASTGVALATLRVQATAALPDETREFLAVAAALGGSAMERTQQIVAMQRAARGSDVTGLPNQRWWRAELDREIRAATKNQLPLTVVLVEIDDFERLSQQQGHVEGDRLLLQLSDGFRRYGHDLLSRMGGEEFVLLLPGRNDLDARHLVSEVRREPSMRALFSVGIARWQPGEAGPQLIARAEGALLDERRRRKLAG